MRRRVPQSLAFDHSVTQPSSACLSLEASRSEVWICILNCIGLRQLKCPVLRMNTKLARAPLEFESTVHGVLEERK